MYPSLGRGEDKAMGTIRSVFFSILALTLAACAKEEGLYLDFVNKECFAEAGKKQSPVNWNQAKVINIAIRDGVYDPDETHMKVGEPTILRFANNDDIPRYFIGGEFLDSVTMAQISVGGAKYDRPCISGVTIAAGKKAELRLVPRTAGIYIPEGHPFWFLGIQQGQSGIIIIER